MRRPWLALGCLIFLVGLLAAAVYFLKTGFPVYRCSQEISMVPIGLHRGTDLVPVLERLDNYAIETGASVQATVVRNGTVIGLTFQRGTHPVLSLDGAGRCSILNKALMNEAVKLIDELSLTAEERQRAVGALRTSTKRGWRRVHLIKIAF